MRLRRWFDLSYLQSAVRSLRRPFRTVRFAVYPVSHANFASVFRTLPFRNFAFCRLLITVRAVRYFMTPALPVLRCDETPHRAHRTTSRHERLVTGRFAPSSFRPIGRIQRFLFIQLKPKYLFRDVTKYRTACTALRVDLHGE